MDIIGLFLTPIATFIGWIDDIINVFIDVIKWLTGAGSVEEALGILGDAFDLIGVPMGTIVDFVKDVMILHLGNLWDAMDLVRALLDGDFTKAWEAVKSIFTRVAQWFDDLTGGALFRMLDRLKELWNWLKDVLGLNEEAKAEGLILE